MPGATAFFWYGLQKVYSVLTFLYQTKKIYVKNKCEFCSFGFISVDYIPSRGNDCTRCIVNMHNKHMYEITKIPVVFILPYVNILYNYV